jgi:hypothetical protein
LHNFVTRYGAVVGDGSFDGKQHVPKLRVASGRATSSNAGLWAAIRGTCGPCVVEAVLGVLRRGLEVGRIEVGVDECVDIGKVAGPLVQRRIGAEVAQGGGSTGLTRCWLVGAGVCRVHLDVGVRECGVRQAETELVDGLDALLVKCTVVDEDTLLKVILWAVAAVGGLVDEVGAILGCVAADGEGQLTARVVTTVQNVGNRVARLPRVKVLVLFFHPFLSELTYCPGRPAQRIAVMFSLS